MHKIIIIFCISVLLVLSSSRNDLTTPPYPTPTTIIISPVSPVSPIYLPVVIR